MDRRRTRPIVRRVSSGLLLLMLLACSKTPTEVTASPSPTQTSRAITSGPRCKLQEREPFPGWFPDEVPLPKGSYFSDDLPPKGGFRRGLLVLSVKAEEFQRFVDTRWEQNGISLFRPDSEPGEVESFFRTAAGSGLFKANDVLCGTPHTRLFFVYRT